MATIIVSGADEAFAPLLCDLIRSLNDLPGKPFDAIGLLDVGLSPATLRTLRPQVTRIVEPEWDFPVDPAVRRDKQHVRATLARPFLQKYFPGYGTYLWMDADTWVQHRYALDWLIEASRHGQIVLASHLDRSYRVHAGVTQWRLGMLNRYFSDLETALNVIQAYYNAGVFCLAADAPHWRAWEKYMRLGLGVSPDLISDQIPLNYALWKDNLPVYPLPALCNWCCHLAMPSLDAAGRLCEPHIPNREIGIVHLTADTKDRTVEARIDGRPVSRSLRYGGLPGATQKGAPHADA